MQRMAASTPARTIDRRRRAVLRGAFGTALALGFGPLAAPRLLARPRFSSDPFTLGVASGYPTPDGVVLWTRLAPEPLAPGGGMPDAVVAVTCELARDPGFRDVVLRREQWATPDWAHSVHCELAGLEPDREYWYRFVAGNARSPAGRTRTAPAPEATPARLRVAVASCQMYEHGYFNAYRQVVADDPGLVVHVGDYIYEVSWGRERVRDHGAPECYTLEDYRARHALYRLDPDLAAAHAAAPWLMVWDDHEVDDDYAGAISEQDDEPRLTLARRAAAYRAYYEHLPLPRRAVPFGPDMRMHATRAWGGLATFHLLDNRQYRDRHACPPNGTAGPARVRPERCPELADPARSMLGARQEAWLGAGLRASRGRWNLLAQSVVMTPTNGETPPAERYWSDDWSGYPAARRRLLERLASDRVANPIVLSGDIHGFMAGELRAAGDAPAPVATEFVTTSLSAQGTDERLFAAYLANSPGLRFATGRSRGYLRLDLEPGMLRADMVAMDTVAEPRAGSRVLASFTVEAGRPGLAEGNAIAG